MSSKLALIAITGLTISAVSLSAAAMVGGAELRDKGFDIFNLPWSDKPRCEFDDKATATNRTIAWDDSDDVSINLPATAHYRPDTGGKDLHVTGDPQLLAHVRLRGGRIELDCRDSDRQAMLDITLPDRHFDSFSLSGDGKLTLEQLNQDKLDIHVAGRGAAEASGRVDDLDLSLAGSGEANTDKLVVKRLDLSIAGGGHADVAAEEEAELSIAGSGKGRLSSGDKSMSKVEVSVAGSGNVEANGKSDSLEVSIMGSGKANLGDLAVKHAEISIAGSGDTTIAPQDRAEVSIMGSGDVHLVTEPKSLETNISGSGHITHPPQTPQP